MITRTAYGVRGHRVNTAITGWAICLCFVSLTLAAAAIATFPLIRKAGIEPNTGIKIVTVVAITSLTVVHGADCPSARAAGGLDLALPVGIAVAATVCLRDAPPPRRTRPPAALTTRIRPVRRPDGRDTLDL
ncbi:hypothetical protein [Streptomyces sp. NPDC056255]|uniref:hypothetical protein n=1 Tax=Streptomyces sp. NPDC056255 TaxID=3345764 RepID=UPI0035D85CA0